MAKKRGFGARTLQEMDTILSANEKMLKALKGIASGLHGAGCHKECHYREGCCGPEFIEMANAAIAKAEGRS